VAVGEAVITLTIYVRDEATDAPIAGAVFSVPTLGISETSGPDGVITVTYPESQGGTYNPWTLEAAGYNTVSGDSLPPVDYTYTQYMSRLLKRTTLTIGASPASVTRGESFTVTGTLTDEDGNPVVGRQVRIDFKVDDTLLGMATETTDSSGNFSHTYTPTQTGTYTIWASFAGDYQYEGCEEEEKW